MIWIVTKQDFVILNNIEVGGEVTPCDAKVYGDEGGAWLGSESEILRHCELYNIPLSDDCFFGEGKNTVRIEYEINGWQHVAVWHIGTQNEVL